jgi:hypothetical protein
VTPSIDVVYVKGNPYPYLMHKEVRLLNGSLVNATSMNKKDQYLVYIEEHEIDRREKIQVES